MHNMRYIQTLFFWKNVHLIDSGSWSVPYVLSLAKIPTEEDAAAHHLQSVVSFLYKMTIIVTRMNSLTQAWNRCKRQWGDCLLHLAQVKIKSTDLLNSVVLLCYHTSARIYVGSVLIQRCKKVGFFKSYETIYL